MSLKFSRLIAAALLVVLISGTSAFSSKDQAFAAGPAISGVSLSSTSLQAFQKLEVTFSLSQTYANPFDPSIIEVWAALTEPGGGAAIYVPGFYFQSYSIDTPSQKVNAAGSPVWKIRFTPTKTGSHSLVLKAKDIGGTTVTSSYAFSVTAASASANGFLKLDPATPKYFVDTNTNKAFFAVGFNADVNTFLREPISGNWTAGSRYIPAVVGYGAQPNTINPYTTYNIYKEHKDVIEAASLHGANAMRILADSYYFPLELPADASIRVNLDTHLTGAQVGNYSIGTYSKEMSWVLDEIFKLAEQQKVRIDLTTWNGIPVVPSAGEAYAFANRNDALIKQRLRYQIARWGYSTSYWTMNYFNEQHDVDMTDAYWTGIHSWVRNLDPYDHLISTSTSWQAGVDYTNQHMYDTNVQHNMTAWHTDTKPFLYEEFGKDNAMGYTPLATSDPDGNYPRMGYFGALVGGNAGGLTWWTRPYYGPRQLDLEIKMYKGISGFLANEDLAMGAPWKQLTNVVNFAATDFPTAKLIASNDASSAFLWVVRTPAVELTNRAPVTGKWIKVPMQTGLDYQVEWWDTVTGVKINTVDAVWEGSNILVNIPNNVGRDIAAKIIGSTTSGNLAPSATLAVSSTHTTYTKDKAVDGNKISDTSRWVSNGPATQWFEMSWPSAKQIGQVKVWSGVPTTPGWHIEAYRVEYWTGSAWATAATVTGNTKDAASGQFNDLTFAPVSTTKIRLFITDVTVNAANDLARLVEVEAYGS